jgi:decaprenylphospho-beta-D-ribofuranose 2-oxidase
MRHFRKFSVGLLLGATIAGFAIHAQAPASKPLANDVTGLNPIPVSSVVSPRTEDEIRAAIAEAVRTHRHISIAGKRHSQGGQTAAPDAIVLDLTHFNRVRTFDAASKVVTVESGATWEQVQDFANPLSLAVEVQQSSNIFTVGGSLSVNCHGRDPNFGPMIQSVRAFRLMDAEGHVRNVSRSENVELFTLVIGGYGLFGVVLDVDLQLTENAVYEKQQVGMDYRKYADYFVQNIRAHPEIGLEYAWPSVRRRDFLRHLAVFSFTKTEKRTPTVFRLEHERNVAGKKMALAGSRHSAVAKDIRWYLQETFADSPATGVISRNNAMRPDVLFLEYHSPSDTDILQEYFAPLSHFVPFMDRLRATVRARNINLLSATVRYVSKDEESYLSYAREDSFAIVLYINQETSPAGRAAAEVWTRELVDAALAEGGTYYLPYQLYPTRAQIRQAYPRIDQFFELKRKYDPNELFYSSFYSYYAKR